MLEWKCHRTFANARLQFFTAHGDVLFGVSVIRLCKSVHDDNLADVAKAGLQEERFHKPVEGRKFASGDVANGNHFATTPRNSTDDIESIKDIFHSLSLD